MSNEKNSASLAPASAKLPIQCLPPGQHLYLRRVRVPEFRSTKDSANAGWLHQLDKRFQRYSLLHLFWIGDERHQPCGKTTREIKTHQNMKGKKSNLGNDWYQGDTPMTDFARWCAVFIPRNEDTPSAPDVPRIWEPS